MRANKVFGRCNKEINLGLNFFTGSTENWPAKEPVCSCVSKQGFHPVRSDGLFQLPAPRELAFRRALPAMRSLFFGGGGGRDAE